MNWLDDALRQHTLSADFTHLQSVIDKTLLAMHTSQLWLQLLMAWLSASISAILKSSRRDICCWGTPTILCGCSTYKYSKHNEQQPNKKQYSWLNNHFYSSVNEGWTFSEGLLLVYKLKKLIRCGVWTNLLLFCTCSCKWKCSICCKYQTIHKALEQGLFNFLMSAVTTGTLRIYHQDRLETLKKKTIWLF